MNRGVNGLLVQRPAILVQELETENAKTAKLVTKAVMIQTKKFKNAAVTFVVSNLRFHKNDALKLFF